MGEPSSLMDACPFGPVPLGHLAAASGSTASSSPCSAPWGRGTTAPWGRGTTAPCSHCVLNCFRTEINAWLCRKMPGVFDRVGELVQLLLDEHPLF